MKKDTDILLDFTETLDCFHILIQGNRGIATISEEEFCNYFTIVSFTLRDDEEFIDSIFLPFKITPACVSIRKDKK